MRQLLIFGFFIAIGAAVGGWYLVSTIPVLPLRVYGATFSPRFAEQFGLDWKAAYRAMLDDLRIRTVRVAAYWDRVEPRRGEYDFSETDWLIAEAGKRGAEIVLAVGQKLPRWPECFVPEWVKELPMEEREAALRIAAIAFETDEGMMVTDENGVIIRVNQAFTRLTGYSAEEVVGKTAAILKSGRHDAAFYQAIRDALECNGYWQGEI